MDVKIFVSHRIDLDAELIDNPIYVPVRCGAVYDRRGGVTMQGDDTGDNISQKRMSFCEFTVQYWAWKNAQADYIGLCHYRRYLSFAGKHLRADAHNMVVEPLLTRRIKAKHGLLDAEGMTAEIRRFDAIVSEPAPVARIPTYTGDQAKNVRELWRYHAGIFVDEHAVDNLLERIDRYAPAYSRSAREYFAGDRHIGYNCFVMKRTLFDRLCSFQFPILFDLEKTLPKETLQTYPRMIGYMGEMLFGVFVYHLIKEQRHIGYRQIMFLEDAGRPPDRITIVFRGMKRRARYIAKKGFDFACPIGTNRRILIKKILKKKKDGEII